jgi:hypothetical protein
MQAIVMYSGGIGSWAAGMRAVERYGVDHTTLLFCDTKMEDEDLYRFLHEGAEVIGVPVTTVADGRTPWEVFKSERFLGNTRVDKCSKSLKRLMRDRWLRTHYAPNECICLLGMDFCQREANRLADNQVRCAPYQVDAPLFWEPVLDKDMAKLMALRHGLRLPRLYELGFQHNNCGGFCVKAGHAHFAHLYRTLPERYAYHEQQEEDLRQYLDKDIAILRDRQGGTTKPLTLRQLRKRLEENLELDFPDADAPSACDCFA